MRNSNNLAQPLLSLDKSTLQATCMIVGTYTCSGKLLCLVHQHNLPLSLSLSFFDDRVVTICHSITKLITVLFFTLKMCIACLRHKMYLNVQR